MRLHTRYTDELKRAKEMYERICNELQNKIRGLDFVHERSVAETVSRMTANGKSRHVKTPFGVAGFRRQGERLTVVSDDLLLEAVAKGDAPENTIKPVTTTRPDMEQIKQHFAATGELLAGCTMTEAFDKFYVK